jgi:hypothetical protein
VSQELGISVSTLERWRADALSRPARERAWTAAARLEAVITTAAMDETQRSAWCREQGLFPADLQHWRENASAALGQPEEARASPQETRGDRRRIKELERDLRRKERAQGARRDGCLVGVVKKTRGDLPAGRGRMISLEDRRSIAGLIEQAQREGARLEAACEVAGIDTRTLQRW